MTFSDLIEHAGKLGYKINQHDNYYQLTFTVNNSTEVELELPDDKMKDIIDDSTSISWKYLVREKLGKNKVYSDWFEYYEGSKETKIQDMQHDILQHLNGFANQKFNIL